PARARRRSCARSTRSPWRPPLARRSRSPPPPGPDPPMLSWDSRLEGWIVAHRVGVLDPVAQGLSYIGVWSAVWLAIAVVLAVVRRRLEPFLWTLVAALAATLTTDAIKALTSRDRPDVDTLVSRPHSSSFPSGHAATSFACATVLAAFAP